MSKPGRKRRVSDEEILRVFRDSPDPVLTATEVAEELPIGKSGVHPRLRDLAANGRLSRKDVGGRAVVWWIENGGEPEAPAAPLKKLVGMLSPAEADRAEERSREWREQFNREIMGDDAPTAETESDREERT